MLSHLMSLWQIILKITHKKLVSVAIDGNITKENFIAKYKRKKPI